MNSDLLDVYPGDVRRNLELYTNVGVGWAGIIVRTLRLDTSDKNLPPLRAGMSVIVDVDTGHARGVPHFLKGLFGRPYRGS